MAQVLTAPLSASPTVRLTDSCTTQESAGVEVDGSPALTQQIAEAVNNPGGDPGVLRSLWWPRHAGNPGSANGNGFVVLTYDAFQDPLQIAADVKAAWAAQGVNGTGVDGFVCFDPPPAAPTSLVAEFQNPGSGEYRLAVGTTEISSLSADGWTQTGDAYHVLGDGACYGGNSVFRFVRTLDGSRGGLLLTVDPAECGLVRKTDPSWRPLDVPFYAPAPVQGACTGTYSGVAVYRLDIVQQGLGRTMHRYTSNTVTYDAMVSQGWTGRGLAFCAMP